jgi:hypothetical protein
MSNLVGRHRSGSRIIIGRRKNRKLEKDEQHSHSPVLFGAGLPGVRRARS